MIPLNATGPPTALRVRDCAYAVVAFTVPPKEIPAASVVLIIVFPDRTVGTELVTLKEAALIAEDPRVRVFVVPEAEATCIAPSGIVEVPTSPNKLIVPSVPALRVREYAPLTVPPKEIPAASVVVIVVFADNTVGTALPTVNEAPLIAVAADPRLTCDAEETLNAPTAVLPPMIPLKVTGPLAPALRVRSEPPLTVPPKEIPSASVVVIVVFPDNTVGAALMTLNEAALIVVVVDPRVS
jgi:hypothetical protein